MARKPNYAFERNARAKAKAKKREAKRQAKLAAKANNDRVEPDPKPLHAGDKDDDSRARSAGKDGQVVRDSPSAVVAQTARR